MFQQIAFRWLNIFFRRINTQKKFNHLKKRQLTFINQPVLLLDKGFCNDSSRRIGRVDRCQQPTISTANTNNWQLFNNNHLPRLPLQKYRTKSDNIQAHIRRCNSITISCRWLFQWPVHRVVHRSWQLSHWMSHQMNDKKNYNDLRLTHFSLFAHPFHSTNTTNNSLPNSIDWPVPPSHKNSTIQQTKFFLMSICLFFYKISV